MKKLAAMLFLDVSLAAVLAGGTYYVNYKMPRRMTPVGQMDSAVTSSGAAAQIQTGQMENEAAPLETAEDRETERPATPDDWSEKFADHFTEEVRISEGHYSGPYVAVDIEEHSFGEGNDRVTYYLADVYIASIDCLRTKFAEDTYGIGYHEALDVMAKDVSAIVAVNGDSYSVDGHMESGVLVRNGELYRAEGTRYDQCVLYRDGVMRIFRDGEPVSDAASAAEIWQTWNFGPALLDENGEIPASYNTNDYIRNSHPRTAIGYYEPGHYCLMVVDGRQENFSRGMYLEEMSVVFHDLGCKAAYNLDGGHCSFMTFGETIASHPYDYSDDISDCIYIAEP